MSETFCVYPWIHAYVGPDGIISPCCFALDARLEDEEGQRFNMETHTFDEAWNSTAMRDIRKKMVQGEKVEACKRCYHKEALGAESSRTMANAEWLSRPEFQDELNERLLSSARNDFRVDGGLAYLDVRPGNPCNLACRMCGAAASSRLAEDRIHRALSGMRRGGRAEPSRRPPKPSRFSDGRPWFKQPDLILHELIRDPLSMRKVYLAGGEPLTNKTVDQILDLLIDAGAAPQVDLTFSTNLTILKEPMLAKLERFQSTRFFASIDGVGRTYDYLRFPATWETIETNLERLRAFPHVEVELTPTVQNCNALDITELMRFAESAGLTYSLSTLYGPDFLSIHAMPERARTLAAERLVAFAAESQEVGRNSYLASTIHALLGDLQQPAPRPYRELMRDFNRFTTDLDADRGQSIRESCPEFFALLLSEGYAWSDELTFAEAPDDITAAA